MSERTEIFRSGYVVVVGRPNVGKSTLVNRLVGARLAPTSRVPQTTRRRLLGILTRDDAQVVFVDTPGVHQPRERLGEALLQSIERALEDAELVLCVADCTRAPGAEDQLVRERIEACRSPRFLVLNKIDRVADGADHGPDLATAYGLAPQFRVSALTGEGLALLTEAIIGALPEGPLYYPPEQLSDAFERDIAGDLIRAEVLGCLGQEVPHAVAVRVEQWKERPNGMLYIRAVLFVERDSQKGIVIGSGGRMLKRIGTAARRVLEDWLERRIYLELEVKVLHNWRKNDRALRWLGYLE